VFFVGIFPASCDCDGQGACVPENTGHLIEIISECINDWNYFGMHKIFIYAVYTTYVILYCLTSHPVSSLDGSEGCCTRYIKWSDVNLAALLNLMPSLRTAEPSLGRETTAYVYVGLCAIFFWRICFVTIDHSLCWSLCHFLLTCLFCDDRPQLMLAFLPSSIDVCVFDEPFKIKPILCVCYVISAV
jgi:hypothetical protein